MSRLILGLAAALLALGLLVGARSIRRALRRWNEARLLAQSRQPRLHAELERLLEVAEPLPALGGWAFTPDLGLLLAPAEGAWLWAAFLGTGCGVFPLVLTLIGLRSRTPDGTAALSGFTQSAGYAIAALGPVGIAALHDATGGWTWPDSPPASAST